MFFGLIEIYVYQSNILGNIKFHKLICIEKRVLGIKLKCDLQNQILRLT